jgi:hypothetical protein
MPVILGGKIRSISVPGQPQQKVCKPHLNQWLDAVAHISHSSYVGSINSKISIQTGLGINVRPYLKNNQVVQVVEHLPSKLKALSSNPSKELLNLRGLFMLQR